MKVTVRLVRYALLALTLTGCSTTRVTMPTTVPAVPRSVPAASVAIEDVSTRRTGYETPTVLGGGWVVYPSTWTTPSIEETVLTDLAANITADGIGTNSLKILLLEARIQHRISTADWVPVASMVTALQSRTVGCQATVSFMLGPKIERKVFSTEMTASSAWLDLAEPDALRHLMACRSELIQKMRDGAVEFVR